MPTPENPLITERPESPIVSETLQQAGITSTPTNVKPVQDNNGKPMFVTPATQSAKIQIPGDQKTLIAQAKGSVNNALTWLAKFLLRMMKKKELEGEKENDANTNQ